MWASERGCVLDTARESIELCRGGKWNVHHMAWTSAQLTAAGWQFVSVRVSWRVCWKVCDCEPGTVACGALCVCVCVCVWRLCCNGSYTLTVSHRVHLHATAQLFLCVTSFTHVWIHARSVMNDACFSALCNVNQWDCYLYIHTYIYLFLLHAVMPHVPEAEQPSWQHLFTWWHTLETPGPVTDSLYTL